MDLEKFYEKAWSKQKVTQLREYISYAIKEINERQFNKDDVISEVYLDYIIENITGITKQGLLSARTIGKTKKQIMSHKDLFPVRASLNTSNCLINNRTKLTFLLKNSIIIATRAISIPTQNCLFISYHPCLFYFIIVSV